MYPCAIFLKPSSFPWETVMWSAEGTSARRERSHLLRAPVLPFVGSVSTDNGDDARDVPSSSPGALRLDRARFAGRSVSMSVNLSVNSLTDVALESDTDPSALLSCSSSVLCVTSIINPPSSVTV